MCTKRAISALGTVLMGTGLCLPLVAQDMSAVEIQSTQLADNVYMLTGMGGNLGVSIGDDGIFLIDDQFAPLNAKITAKIAELSQQAGVSSERVFLVNTHFHFDHTGGNELTGESGAVIVAHENVRQRLTVEQVVPFFNMRHPALKPAGLPVITFTSDVTLHLNGDEIDVFHVALAHTDGDAVVHFKGANVIHTGDIGFIGTYPFIDLDNGGSVAGFLAATARIIELCDDETQVIPGHGPLIDKTGLEAYHAMMSKTYGAVKELVAKGLSLEEAQAAKPTAKYDDDWSGFINADGYVSLLYRDLTEE